MRTDSCHLILLRPVSPFTLDPSCSEASASQFKSRDSDNRLGLATWAYFVLPTSSSFSILHSTKVQHTTPYSHRLPSQARWSTVMPRLCSRSSKAKPIVSPIKYVHISPAYCLPSLGISRLLPSPVLHSCPSWVEVGPDCSLALHLWYDLPNSVGKGLVLALQLNNLGAMQPSLDPKPW